MARRKGVHPDVLAAALERHGVLVLNVHPDLPSVEGSGSDWWGIMGLIRERRAFFTRALRGRTLYLSPAVYACLKPLRQRLPERGFARDLYELLDGAEGLEGEMAADLLEAPKRQVDETIAALADTLAITVLGEGRMFGPRWTGYAWGSARTWEASRAEPLPAPADPIACRARLRELVEPVLRRDWRVLLGDPGVRLSRAPM